MSKEKILAKQRRYMVIGLIILLVAALVASVVLLMRRPRTVQTGAALALAADQPDVLVVYLPERVGERGPVMLEFNRPDYEDVARFVAEAGAADALSQLRTKLAEH